MNKLTPEELLLQILATCLLINTQGKWHAFYSLAAHVGTIDVRVTSSDNDYQAKNLHNGVMKEATFTSTNRHPHTYLTEDTARQALIDLLAWTQGHLNMEAAA